MQVSPPTRTHYNTLAWLATVALLCALGPWHTQRSAFAAPAPPRPKSPKQEQVLARTPPQKPTPAKGASQPTSRGTSTPKTRAQARPVRTRPASRPALPHEAAKGCIKGRVLGPDSKPMANAQIVTMPQSSEKMTDKSGHFMLCFRRILHGTAQGVHIVRKRLPLGHIEVIVRKFGFYTARRTLSFTAREVTLPDVKLATAPSPLCVANAPGLVKGKRHGTERRCWPSGALMFVRDWHKGQRHGRFQFMTATGQLYERAYYQHGIHHGHYTRWDAKGAKTCQGRWLQGRPAKAWRCLTPPKPTPKPATRPTPRPNTKPTPRPIKPQPRKAKPGAAQLPKAFERLAKKAQDALLAAIAQDSSPHKLGTRPWLAWIRARGPGRHLVRPFTIPQKYLKGLPLRVVALGEQKHLRVVDKAWIEDRATGQIVWQMTHKNTRTFGADRRHRLADQGLTLRPGRYVLHYSTDSTHDPSHWITLPPPQAHRYGVVLYIPSSRGYATLTK